MNLTPKTIQRLFGLLFLLILLLAFFSEEIGKTYSYIFIGISIAIIAWLDGYERGRRQVKPINFIRPTLSISQSLHGGPNNIFTSFDCTEREFELDQDTYLKILSKFTKELPFQQGVEKDFLELVSLKEFWPWPGIWLFQTYDMNMKPVFLSDIAMTEIMDFFIVYDIDLKDINSTIDSKMIPNMIRRQKEKWWKILEKNGKVKIEDDLD